MKNIYILSKAFLFLIGCAEYDIIIRDGILYDGTGSKPFTGDIGIKNDKIVKISKSIDGQAKEEVDASGLAVSPGFIKTEMTDKINEEFKKTLISKIPSGDLGSGEDVSNCVAFLASDMAKYINGETIHVNGGMYMA